MDTIIVAALLGLGMAAELTLGQPQLVATGVSLLAVVLYMLLATFMLLSGSESEAPTEAEDQLSEQDLCMVDEAFGGLHYETETLSGSERPLKPTAELA